jgi:hypothetical protein
MQNARQKHACGGRFYTNFYFTRCFSATLVLYRTICHQTRISYTCPGFFIMEVQILYYGSPETLKLHIRNLIKLARVVLKYIYIYIYIQPEFDQPDCCMHSVRGMLVLIILWLMTRFNVSFIFQNIIQLKE